MKWHPLPLLGANYFLSLERGQDRPSIHWITADCRQLTEIPSDSFPLVVAGHQGYPSLWSVEGWCVWMMYGCMPGTARKRKAIDPCEGHDCTCWCFLIPLVDLIQLLYALPVCNDTLKCHLWCTCPMSLIQSLEWVCSTCSFYMLKDLISVECAQDKSTLDAFFCFELSRGEGTSVVQHRRFLETTPPFMSPHYSPTREGHDQHALAIMEFLKEDCLVRVIGTQIRTVHPCAHTHTSAYRLKMKLET